MRDQLERGFRRLTPEHRVVLVLHHYLGMGDTEAAQVLEIPVATFKNEAPSSRRRHARGARGRRAYACRGRGSPSHERERHRPDTGAVVRGGRAGHGAGRCLDQALAGVRRHRPRAGWLATPGSHWGWTDPGGSSAIGSRVMPRSALSWSGAVFLILVLGAMLSGAILVGGRLLEASPPPTSLLGRLAYPLDGDMFLADADGGNAALVADGLPSGWQGCGTPGYWAEEPCGRPMDSTSPIAPEDGRPIARARTGQLSEGSRQ